MLSDSKISGRGAPSIHFEEFFLKKCLLVLASERKEAGGGQRSAIGGPGVGAEGGEPLVSREPLQGREAVAFRPGKWKDLHGWEGTAPALCLPSRNHLSSLRGEKGRQLWRDASRRPFHPQPSGQSARPTAQFAGQNTSSESPPIHPAAFHKTAQKSAHLCARLLTITSPTEHEYWCLPLEPLCLTHGHTHTHTRGGTGERSSQPI